MGMLQEVGLRTPKIICRVDVCMQHNVELEGIIRYY